MKRTLIALLLSICMAAAAAGCAGNAKKKPAGDKKKTEKKVDPKKDKAEREKLAGELFTAMKMNDNFVKQLKQFMTQQVQQQIGFSIQSALTQEQLQKNAQYFQTNVPNMIKDLEKKVDGILDEKTMKDKVFVPIYAKDLKVDELKVLIDFYKTPAGQKLLKKDTDFRKSMVDKTSELMMPHTQKLAQEFTDKIKKDITALEGGGTLEEKPAEGAKQPEIKMNPPKAGVPAKPRGKK